MPCSFSVLATRVSVEREGGREGGRGGGGGEEEEGEEEENNSPILSFWTESSILNAVCHRYLLSTFAIITIKAYIL